MFSRVRYVDQWKFRIWKGTTTWGFEVFSRWTGHCVGGRAYTMPEVRERLSLGRWNFMSQDIAEVLRRRRVSAAKGEAHCKCWSVDYPLVHALLTACVVEGVSRETASLTIFSDEGIFKVVLNDREQGISMWAAGESVPEAFDQLEKRVGDENATWRESSSGRRKKK